MSKKLYTSDEDKIMQNKSLTWSEPAIMSKDLKNVYVNDGWSYCEGCEDSFLDNENCNCEQ